MTKDQIQKAAEYISYLANRWSDESEYEEFSEYVDAMKKHLPKDVTSIKMTRRPFACSFTHDNILHRLRVKRTTVEHLQSNATLKQHGKGIV